MEKLIASKRVGTRTIAGTDWPVENQVLRVAQPGRRVYWTLVMGLCNGVPRGSQRFASKAAALAAMEE